MAIPGVRSDAAPRRVIFHTLVGDVRLVLQGAGRPTDAEIDQHITEAVAMASAVRAVLVFAEGRDAVGPDAGQRAKMARAGLLRIPTAVVTASALARGVMTAVSWLGAPIQGFAPEHLLRAFEFLKISPPVRARIPAQLDSMRAALRAPYGDGRQHTTAVFSIPSEGKEPSAVALRTSVHIVDGVGPKAERRKLSADDLPQIDVRTRF
jgi:hypothetical protein